MSKYRLQTFVGTIQNLHYLPWTDMSKNENDQKCTFYDTILETVMPKFSCILLATRYSSAL